MSLTLKNIYKNRKGVNGGSHLVGGGRRTAGRAPPAGAIPIPRPPVAEVIATRRNWWRLRGAEHAQHLLRRNGSLLVPIAARVLLAAHRPTTGRRRGGQGARRSGGHVAGGWGAEIGTAASRQRAALGGHARRVEVVVRRVGSLDDRVWGARRRVVQSAPAASSAQRARAVAHTGTPGRCRCRRRRCWGSHVGSAARRRTNHAEGQANVLRLVAARHRSVVRYKAARSARGHARRRLCGSQCGTEAQTGGIRMVSVGSGTPARGSKITEFGIVVASCAHCQGVAVVWNATAPKAHYTAGTGKGWRMALDYK